MIIMGSRVPVPGTKQFRKDISIELTRIIACFLVICIHIDIGFMTAGEISRNALFLACIRADAVGIFWLIAGMHFFKERPYTAVLKNMVRRIVVPSLVLIGVIFFFSEWALQGQTLRESMTHSGAEYAAFFKTLFLEWRTPVSYSGQLWYVFVYVLLCFLQPVGAAFVKYLDTDKKKKVFCLVSFSFLVLNDFSLNQFGNFSHQTFGAAVPAMILMIWGKLLYEQREKIKNKRNLFLAAGGFLGINLLRCFIQFFESTHRENPSQNILFWYTSIGLCCAVAVYVMCLIVTARINERGKLANGIRFVGSKTFSIYLLHMLVKELLMQKGLGNVILSWTGRLHQVLLRQGLYYLIFGAVIFGICLGVGIVVSAVVSGTKQFR